LIIIVQFQGNKYDTYKFSAHDLPKNILQITFSPAHEYAEQAYKRFFEGYFGQLHQATPWAKLAKLVKPSTREIRGRKPIFDARG